MFCLLLFCFVLSFLFVYVLINENIPFFFLLLQLFIAISSFNQSQRHSFHGDFHCRAVKMLVSCLFRPCLFSFVCLLVLMLFFFILPSLIFPFDYSISFFLTVFFSLFWPWPTWRGVNRRHAARKCVLTWPISRRLMARLRL